MRGFLTADNHPCAQPLRGRVAPDDRVAQRRAIALFLGGRQPGQFFGVHSIATDSQGNIYTTETYEGKRIQKFVYRGLAPIPGESQGVLWPR